MTEAVAGDPVVVSWLSCVKEGSRLTAEPATPTDWGKSGAGSRWTSAGGSAVCQACDGPGWEGIMEAVRGEDAELVCAAAGRTKVSRFWVRGGESRNPAAKASNRWALWSGTGFILPFCPAVDRTAVGGGGGVAASAGLGLLLCTLEHVCKWVRRPRYDRNLVRQLSHLRRERSTLTSSFSGWIWIIHDRTWTLTERNSLEIYVGFVMMPHVVHEFLHVREGAVAAGTWTQQDFPCGEFKLWVRSHQGPHPRSGAWNLNYASWDFEMGNS